MMTHGARRFIACSYTHAAGIKRQSPPEVVMPDAAVAPKMVGSKMLAELALSVEVRLANAALVLAMDKGLPLLYGTVASTFAVMLPTL